MQSIIQIILKIVFMTALLFQITTAAVKNNDIIVCSSKDNSSMFSIVVVCSLLVVTLAGVEDVITDTVVSCSVLFFVVVGVVVPLSVDDERVVLTAVDCEVFVGEDEIVMFMVRCLVDRDECEIIAEVATDENVDDVLKDVGTVVDLLSIVVEVIVSVIAEVATGEIADEGLIDVSTEVDMLSIDVDVIVSGRTVRVKRDVKVLGMLNCCVVILLCVDDACVGEEVELDDSVYTDEAGDDDV